jgi:hypothetical protein
VTGRYRTAIVTGAVLLAFTTGCTPEGSDDDPAATTATDVSSTSPTPLSADLRDGEVVILSGEIRDAPVDVPEVGSNSFAVYVRCDGGHELSIVYQGPSSPFEAPCDGVPTRVEIHLESDHTPLSIEGTSGKTGEYVIAQI